MHEGVWLKNNPYVKTVDNFPIIVAFVYVLIVPKWTDQLLPQLLMEQLNNLPLLCKQYENMHE